MREAATKEPHRSTSHTKLADFCCDHAEFDFDVTLDKFDLDGFKKPFQSKFKEPLTPGVSFAAVASPRDPTGTDYHVHLNWYVSKNQMNVKLGYHSGELSAVKGEKEPFAENAMQWLGEYFKADQASAHVHIAFDYPAENWRFSIPLPIKIPLGQEPEVEIDGMSLSLERQPLGLNQAWLISREKRSRVLLHGNRTVHFDRFQIVQEIAEISGLATTFVKKEVAK